MARVAQLGLFPSEKWPVHVTNRVALRCFLLGDVAVTGKNVDHWKVWVEGQLRLLASQ